ncbi:MAG: hypothetical protein ACI8SR_000405 [Oceanicoccus sp.]|jgi:hypothetical protein
MKKIVLCTIIIGFLAGCSGLRTTDTTFMVHAENFNFLFLQIPGGDSQKRAMALMPQDAQIDTLISTPDDMTSLLGVLNRIIGLDYTTINGRMPLTPSLSTAASVDK